jgi:hypothetical protein
MTSPLVPSQASIPWTSSSQLPVGGLNVACLRLAGGVVEPGCLVSDFRDLLEPLVLGSGVPIVEGRPLFFLFVRSLRM